MNHAPSPKITPPGYSRAGLAGALAALVLWSMPLAVAGTAAGIAAFESGNYERAYAELKPEAEAGDPEAQYYLGGMYWQGHGVGQNLNSAAHWMTRAGDQGHVGAILELGYMYSNGIGVRFDKGMAAELYRRAADAGDPIAQRNLGLMYRQGEGMERDYHEAAKWFRKAAIQGDVVAQTELGQMYWMERGVEEDIDQSLLWLRRAAEQGHAEAQYLLCSKYTSLYPPKADQLVEGMKWCKLAADQDYPGGVKLWDAATRWFVSAEQKEKAAELARQWHSTDG